MVRLVFNVCIMALFISGFGLLFGVFGWILDFACAHIQPLNVWVNSVIGTDENDSEERYK